MLVMLIFEQPKEKRIRLTLNCLDLYMLDIGRKTRSRIRIGK